MTPYFNNKAPSNPLTNTLYFGSGPYFSGKNEPIEPADPVFLAQEDGFLILQEDGFPILEG